MTAPTPPLKAPALAPDAQAVCPPGFESLLRYLHDTFEPRRQALLAERHDVLARVHAGQLPAFRRGSEAWHDGRIDLPDFADDQRNQMTGPADEAKLVINLCNSGAPGCMLDLEDSITTFWPNVSCGIANAVAAVHETLTYVDPRSGKRYEIRPTDQVVYTRPRGMHLDETHALRDEVVSGSLFDLALVLFQIHDAPQRRRCLYVPKVESAAEARWWIELIAEVERAAGLPVGSTKLMLLIESFTAAFPIEPSIEAARSHVIGLNLGRWDYMASLIHFKLADPGWIFPDRNTIPVDVPFFRTVRKLIVELCNRHGIVPIGGMTALFPSKDP